MKEIINSVGIDIGTSTTQLIFSKITIQNMATSYTVPRISIVATEVIYRSDIYFTPLTNSNTIDAEKVKEIVKSEYQKAKINPKDLQTGAVIITGETARKENANEVLSALSEMAGDFVVATAGPDLESVLSARGAGTDMMSKEDRNVIANIDIGGGTSNIAVYDNGNIVSTSCLDIGGRLIKIENGKILYIYEKIAKLASTNGIDIKVGDPADESKLRKIAKIMSSQIAMAINLIPKDEYHGMLYTNEGNPINSDIKIDGVTFSGGVADIIYNDKNQSIFTYGDIGVLLGREIKNDDSYNKAKIYQSIETIRATVVGAGTHTTEVSGSTIKYDEECLPVKNVPVVKMSEEEEKNLEVFSKKLLEKIDIFANRNKEENFAVALSGQFHQSFDDVQELAKAIIDGTKTYENYDLPLIVIVENDIGKVLGNALTVQLEHRKKVLCIDNIFVKEGDCIDIGEPLGQGRVVPVITKTLIFNH